MLEAGTREADRYTSAGHRDKAAGGMDTSPQHPRDAIAPPYSPNSREMAARRSWGSVGTLEVFVMISDR